MNKGQEENLTWTFKKIIGHRKKGTKWSLKVLWHDDTNTWELLETLAIEDPVTCAQYAHDNGLLNTPGFKRFKSYVKRKKKYIRMLRQAQLCKVRTHKEGPKFQFGVRVPRNYKEALVLDKPNSNNHWQEAIQKELDQIKEYETFIP